MTKTIKKTVTPKYHTQTFDVEVVKNKSIKIKCFFENMREPREFVNEFKVGDQAEYDSWNLSYYGEIVSITENTVTIKKPGYTTKTRMKLGDFCYRNYNFNLEEAKAHNSEEMMYL